MPHRTPVLPLLAALVLLALGWPCGDALAQAAPVQRRLTVTEPAEAPAAPTIVVDFPGGTVAEYVAFLREYLPTLNVVLDPEAADVAMPPVSLNRVTVATALDLLQATAAARERNVAVEERVHRQGEGTSVFVVTTVVPRFVGVPASSTRVRRNPIEPAADSKQLHVASLSDIIDGDSGAGAVEADTVLTAIDTVLGIQFSAAGEKAVVKFHADSGLLIVQGSTEQIDAVQQVLGEIQRTMRRPMPSPDEVQTLRSQVAMLLDQIDILRAEIRDQIDILRAELEALKGAADKAKEQRK